MKRQEEKGIGGREKNQHWITKCFLCTTWSLSLGARRVCLCVCLHVCVCGCACKWMEVLKSHRCGADPVSSARRLTAARLPPSWAKSVWHVCTDTHFVSYFLSTVPYIPLQATFDFFFWLLSVTACFHLRQHKWTLSPRHFVTFSPSHVLLYSGKFPECFE